MLAMMQQFPLFLDLDRRPVLVVGGGKVAARKVRNLTTTGAHIKVVAPTLGDSLQTLVEAGRIVHDARRYNSGEAADYWLSIAATDNTQTNAEVAHDALAANALVNVTDAPHLGNVTFASVVNRNPLQIAISSGGHSPILSRLIRARIAAFIPPSYGQLAEFAGEYREQIKARFQSLIARRNFWESVLTGPISQRILAGDVDTARQELEAQLSSQNENLTYSLTTSKGEVYLVGAGPGDPDLLTFRALRLMHQADVVLHDRLVSDEILALCPDTAEYIYVGKRRAQHTMQQITINETLVKHAKAGKRVLRLKGGDPFIFGRGGEEIETLAEAGVRFEVVPGITAASGCASYAGIPLTHRDHAQACLFVTGHLKAGELELNWTHLVQPNQTVVCYMGLTALPQLCSKLLLHGLPATTPAAIIERGTTNRQRVITGTVSNLPQLVTEQSVRAPTLIIIGSVVTLRDSLQWFTPLQPAQPSSVPPTD